MFVTLDDTRKNTAKTFVIAKKAIFWNDFFCQPPRSQRNVLIISTINVKTPCGPLYCVLWHFSCSMNWEKEAKVFFLLERLPCFSQLCVLKNLLGPKKRSFIFQSKGQNSFWTVIKCSLMFVTLDDTRRRGQKFFSTWKQFFFEMFVPIDPLDPEEIIWSFAQKMSVYLVDPYNMSHDIFLVR